MNICWITGWKISSVDFLERTHNGLKQDNSLKVDSNRTALNFPQARVLRVSLYIWISVMAVLSLKFISLWLSYVLASWFFCISWGFFNTLTHGSWHPPEETTQSSWMKESTIPWNLHTCMLCERASHETLCGGRGEHKRETALRGRSVGPSLSPVITRS